MSLPKPAWGLRVLFSSTMDPVVPLRLPKSRKVMRVPEYKPHADAPKAKKKKWPWIVAASAVVVGAGIATGVVLSQRSKSSSESAAGAVTVSW